MKQAPRKNGSPSSLWASTGVSSGSMTVVQPSGTRASRSPRQFQAKAVSTGRSNPSASPSISSQIAGKRARVARAMRATALAWVGPVMARK